MDLATLCTFVASLRLVPNRSQFFQYEKVSLSCSSNWTILRNTSLHKNQRTTNQNRSSWFFNNNIYYRDSGVYWCQSEDGECGAAVNITVTAGSIILDSPLLPVTEGQNVTLQCIIDPNNKATSEETFQFFKDGLWIGNSSSGDLSLSSVSVEDSGFYMCRCGDELSTERPLQVTAERPQLLAPPPSPLQPMKIPLYRLLCFLFLFLLYTVVLCIGLCIYCKWTLSSSY